MTNKKYECMSLRWDTDYFGINSARVNLDDVVNEKDKEEILAFCRAYDFVTLSNKDNRQENNLWLGISTTAFLTDINIQFQKFLVASADFQDEKTYVENHFASNDQFLEIARKSFKYSRFFNDPKLPREQARNIYPHWTECAFGRENKYFVYSVREGQIAGFLLFSLIEAGSIIELIAVDEKYQGQKVGMSLIHAMESFVFKQGVRKIKVGTQVNNIQAAQFYHAMGFKYVSCGSIYHWWRE